MEVSQIAKEGTFYQNKLLIDYMETYSKIKCFFYFILNHLSGYWLLVIPNLTKALSKPRELSHTFGHMQTIC